MPGRIPRHRPFQSGGQLRILEFTYSMHKVSLFQLVLPGSFTLPARVLRRDTSVRRNVPQNGLFQSGLVRTRVQRCIEPAIGYATCPMAKSSFLGVQTTRSRSAVFVSSWEK